MFSTCAQVTHQSAVYFLGKFKQKPNFYAYFPIFLPQNPRNPFRRAPKCKLLQVHNAGAACQSKEGSSVKLIIATIKPFKLEEVREALTDAGVRGLMVTEIKGFGAQSGHTEIYRGAEYVVNFVPKIKLELVVADGIADQIVEVISRTAQTGKIGDGKIFVIDVEQAVRVRTGETGDDAI